MNTRARISASFGLAIGPALLLASNRAAALDEPVEKAQVPVVHAEIDREQFRNDVDAYVRALADSLRSAVAAPQKPAAPPAEDIELAAAQPRTRG